jgi:hypothetical protein
VSVKVRSDGTSTLDEQILELKSSEFRIPSFFYIRVGNDLQRSAPTTAALHLVSPPLHCAAYLSLFSQGKQFTGKASNKISWQVKHRHNKSHSFLLNTKTPESDFATQQ